MVWRLLQGGTLGRLLKGERVLLSPAHDDVLRFCRKVRQRRALCHGLEYQGPERVRVYALSEGATKNRMNSKKQTGLRNGSETAARGHRQNL